MDQVSATSYFNITYPEASRIKKKLAEKLPQTLPPFASFHQKYIDLISTLASIELSGKPRLPQQAWITSEVVVLTLKPENSDSVVNIVPKEEVSSSSRESFENNTSSESSNISELKKVLLSNQYSTTVNKMQTQALWADKVAISELLYGIRIAIDLLNRHNIAYQNMTNAINRHPLRNQNQFHFVPIALRDANHPINNEEDREDLSPRFPKELNQAIRETSSQLKSSPFKTSSFALEENPAKTRKTFNSPELSREES